MSERSKLTYPNAIRKRVEGDWNCPTCSNLNFAFRDSCNRCGYTERLMPTFNAFLYISAPSLDEAVYLSESIEHPPPRLDISQLPSISPFLRERYLQERIEINPVTKRVLKFDKENVENKPSEDSEEKKGKVEKILTHIKRPLREKEGDWVCLKCTNLNFAFRDACNICKEAKCFL